MTNLHFFWGRGARKAVGRDPGVPLRNPVFAELKLVKT